MSVTTDADGTATIPLFGAAVGQIVTATATARQRHFGVLAVRDGAGCDADGGPGADDDGLGGPGRLRHAVQLRSDRAEPRAAAGGRRADHRHAAGRTDGDGRLGLSGHLHDRDDSVTCNIGTLGVNGTATVTITVTSSISGTLTNSASIFAELQDPVPGNNSDSEQTTIQLASCSGVTFTGPTPYAGSAGPMAVVRLVDMNHDGRLDAVATHEGGSNGVDVFLNDGAGHFAAPRFTSTVTGPWLHVVADFNGDTHPDVITATDRTAFGGIQSRCGC